MEQRLQTLEIVPVCVQVVADILLEDAGVVDLLCPGRNAMVIALKKDDFFAAGKGAGGHHRKCGDVVAVFGKECPVGGFNGFDEQLGKIDHHSRGRGDAVLLLALLPGGLVNIGVAVAEDIRAVGAHIVNEAVAVNVPEVSPLRALGKERECVHRDKTALRRALMAVHAGRDHPQRALEELAAVFICIGFVFHFLFPICLHAR